MNVIDKRAVIDSSAKIADDVTIGPYAIIGANVEIGSGTSIGSHAVISGPSRIGRDNKIFQFSSIGEDPQDIKYKGEETILEIGDRNIFREFCTIHRGTTEDKGITKIGNDNLFMNYVHIAHDSHIADHTIFSNNASLAGHVHVEDHVVLGGFAAVYQFCRLGAHSFVAAGAFVVKDVLPFIRVAGVYAKPYGLNVVGLRRQGFDQNTRNLLKKAYRIIYREGLETKNAIEQLKPLTADCPYIDLYIQMLKTAKHGIAR